MDKEVIKKHWDLVKMGAVHDYLPDKSQAEMKALIIAYGQPVDTSCGACQFEMLKRMYNTYKDEFGE